MQLNNLDNVKDVKETSLQKRAEFNTFKHNIRRVSTAGIPGKYQGTFLSLVLLISLSTVDGDDPSATSAVSIRIIIAHQF